MGRILDEEFVKDLCEPEPLREWFEASSEESLELFLDVAFNKDLREPLREWLEVSSEESLEQFLDEAFDKSGRLEASIEESLEPSLEESFK